MADRERDGASADGTARRPTARFLARTAALIGLAGGVVRHERLRSVASVLGIALAVLAIVLLGGAGVGVLETGQAQFDAAERDLWVTGETVGLTAAGGGGFEPTVRDAHELSATLESRDDVRTAAPMGFQTLYVGTDPDDLETIVGSGVTGGGDAISMRVGADFSGPDAHYANGSYDGPLSGEAIVDGETAERFDLSVGDTIYVGGSLATARRTEYEVIGVSETFASFLGTPTVTLRLSELQTLTGSSGTDAATLVAVTLADDADPETVAAELEAAYPDHQVRTNDEQLRAILGERAALLVGAGLLVVLAVVAGAALAISLFALSVYQHRRAYRTLSAIGVSRRTIVGLVTVRGLVVGLLGWLVGVALALPATRALNALVTWIVGYEGLVVFTPAALALGALVAVGIGVLAAAVAAWRLPSAAV